MILKQKPEMSFILTTFYAKSFNVKSSVIEGSSGEKFLGITIDSSF